VQRLREDWMECVELWVRRQVGYDVWYLNEGGFNSSPVAFSVDSTIIVK
jgi:hypothetical protein